MVVVVVVVKKLGSVISVTCRRPLPTRLQRSPTGTVSAAADGEAVVTSIHSLESDSIDLVGSEIRSVGSVAVDTTGR